MPSIRHLDCIIIARGNDHNFIARPIYLVELAIVGEARMSL